jgi:hypothetical protein
MNMGLLHQQHPVLNNPRVSRTLQPVDLELPYEEAMKYPHLRFEMRIEGAL